MEKTTCVVCGCTDDKACKGGCEWTVKDGEGKGLCSKCHKTACHPVVDAEFNAEANYYINKLSKEIQILEEREELSREILFSPFMLLKPALGKDPINEQWLCILGGPKDALNNGLVGRGKTPQQAAMDFNKNYKNQTVSKIHSV